MPKLFDELVATATARNTHDRFRDAADFLAALDDVAADLGLPAYVVPAPRNSAAHRAAEHPTHFGSPRGTDDAAQRRLFPADDAPTRVSPVAPPVPTPAPVRAAAPAPVQAPVPAPAQPAAVRPERAPEPVSNRSGIGLVLYLVVALVVVAGVALGAWWFGSGMYGEIPELIAPTWL